MMFKARVRHPLPTCETECSLESELGGSAAFRCSAPRAGTGVL